MISGTVCCLIIAHCFTMEKAIIPVKTNGANGNPVKAAKKGADAGSV